MTSSARVKGVDVCEGLVKFGLVVMVTGMCFVLGCGDNPDNPGPGDRVVWFVDGDSYSFGKVPANSASSHGFEIRTADGVSVENDGLSLSSGTFGYFQIADTDCGNVIEDRCTVNIEFAPAQSGGYSNRLLLDYTHNGEAKKVLIVMSGEGT
jgi:hypothetical protein